MNNGKARPLSEVEPGQPVVIVALEGGFECQHRLISLGLFVNQEVRVLKSSRGYGPVLLAVGEARLALGQSMARKVMAIDAAQMQSQQRLDQSSEKVTARDGVRASVSRYLKRKGENMCRGEDFGIK